MCWKWIEQKRIESNKTIEQNKTKRKKIREWFALWNYSHVYQMCTQMNELKATIAKATAIQTKKKWIEMKWNEEK